MTETRLPPQALDELEQIAKAADDVWPDADGWLDDGWTATEAKHIAAFNPETARQIITALRTEREARETAERERDEAKRWYEATLSAHATPEIFNAVEWAVRFKRERAIRDEHDALLFMTQQERDALAQQVDELANNLRLTHAGAEATAREATRSELENKELRQQVEALRQELPSCDGCGHPAVDHEGHPLATVDKGACEQFESTSDRLTAELEAAQQDAARLREALREVHTSGVELDDPRMDYVVVQVDRVTWNEIAALTAPADPTGGQ